MRQNWNFQWKPNQTVNIRYVRPQRRYYGRSYPALATVGAVFGVIIILAAIVAIL